MKNKFTVLKICLDTLLLIQFANAGQNDVSDKPHSGDVNATTSKKIYTKKDARTIFERTLEATYVMLTTLAENKSIKNKAEIDLILDAFSKTDNGKKMASLSAFPDVSEADFKKDLMAYAKVLRQQFFVKNPEDRIVTKRNFDDKARKAIINFYKKFNNDVLLCANDKLNAVPDGLNIEGLQVYVFEEYARCTEEVASKIKKEQLEKENKEFMSRRKATFDAYVKKGDVVVMCGDTSIKTNEGVDYCVKSWVQSKSFEEFKGKVKKAANIKGESRGGFLNGVGVVSYINQFQKIAYDIALCIGQSTTAAQEQQCYANTAGIKSWAK